MKFFPIVALILTGSIAAQPSIESKQHTFRVELFAEGFGIPWGMAFLPDGRLLVSEREGLLRIVALDGSLSAPISGVPEVHVAGQGGLLDIALHPQYSENQLVYLTFSEPLKQAEGDVLSHTVLARGRLQGLSMSDLEVIYRVPERFYTKRGYHYGSRIVFDRAGYLFFTIGDRGQRNLAQDVEWPNGKVHRLYDDGRVPEDNPFVDQTDAIASIWSYGHRNQQGLALHPQTGELWASEHGPRGGDELNHIRKGLNYGWPAITYGINYDGTKITDQTEAEDMEQPQTYWIPSLAVCGIDFYAGAAFSKWQNDLFVSSLSFNRLHRVRLDGTKVVEDEMVYQAESRVRDVQTGPDGSLYLALEDPGRIVRLSPLE